MNAWLIFLLIANVAALTTSVVLYRKLRKARKTRRVEAPNSEYKSPYVLDLEARERWKSLDLSRLHEVNREEVEKLLVKLESGSVRPLSPTERAFLDRMVEAEDRVKARARASADAARAGAKNPRHLPT